MLFIGLDDTDTLGSRGTGHLARTIAAALSEEHTLVGVTRHQLLVDPRVPCTKNNSSAAIVLEENGTTDIATLFAQVQDMMLNDLIQGSDPGLCVTDAVPSSVTRFGRRVQQELVTQQEAHDVADALGIHLIGLGGNNDGVIGALAAVGLSAGQEDGRYVLVGRSRELSGLQPVSSVLAAGIAAVRTFDGEIVTDGLIQTDKLRPARRGGLPIAIVEWAGDYWRPLKLD